MTDYQEQVADALDAARDATTTALATAHAGAAAAGTDLVPAGADAAVSVKARMAGAHAQVAKARTAALEKVNSARELIEAQKAELDRQARALELELAPLKETLALMQEGIWTMNLYLGRDEEIRQIAEGAPAPAGTPIHVRQMVLAMDEESAVNAEGNGIDFRSVDAFDEWVTCDPAHLQQVLPEERGVVAIMARRSEIDYKDPWANKEYNKRNRHTYFLIRNGGALYRMDTNFEVGYRLVPARNEFTSMFLDRHTGQPLVPGTDKWLAAEKLAGARERHYMRVALILQGLIDRTHVFAPLPKPGVSLLTPADYDEGHVVLIADDESALTTGRTPFYDWLRSLNSQLRPGMRVMVTTRHKDWPSGYRDGGHERIWPNRAEYPRAGQVYTIARAGSRPGEFVVTYKRTQETWVNDGWGGGEYRVPKTAASCSIFVSDRFVLPIDLVDVETMRTYLGARLERHAYADMFPTLTAAIGFLEEEKAVEAPFRDLLAAQVAQAEGVDLDTAAALVAPVITSWKVGARWFRPMSGDPEAEARAATAILAERARIARADAGAGDDDAFLRRARREHRDALLVARKKDGTYVVLTPATRAWGPAAGTPEHASVPQDVWVHVHEYTRTGKARPVRQWQIVPMASLSRWIILHEAQAWSTWKRAARPADHLSDPEINEAISRIRDRAFPGLTLIAIGYDERGGWWNSNSKMEFTAWYHPGPVTIPERVLTGELPTLYAKTIAVRASREGDGSIGLSWIREPSTNNTTVWERFRGRFRDAEENRPAGVPWNDNRRHRMVFLDPVNLPAAHADADAWVEAHAAADQLESQADKALRGVQDGWTEARVAAARDRFMEDYADETLWAAEEARVRGTLVAPWRTTTDDEPWDALRYLALRLTEEGRTPWGLTVAEAIEALDEPLNPKLGSRQRHWAAKETLREPLPEGLLTLRFATEPTGTDVVVAGAAS
ncbi:hypothetical protein CHO01_17250 [Cellulomonas hominis]|uniref:Prefoldin subunit 5 n=1 Tax=Cellulomonas hominis TaxID=156981 RepID=A0A511FBG5_9CELL|nr:hypothetical protein [Cellulomonas hominis]MBB5474570.1 prefoldin subunit 5 [Cellulomonas hominis]NKY05580.1 hypothetical protein [Cellulomonas hominis]GEL46609.1 hypothetical protein CHO01_17250 [Cellulomonas hominis]